MNKYSQFLAAMCLAFVAFGAESQQRNPVESRLEARRVTTGADGKESLAVAETARPGDLIEYSATYRNNGTNTVRNLEATLPIPADTEYVAGSARPASARASADANAFAPVPLTRKAMVNGREVESPVPVREYRALRWYPGDLAAKQSLTFTARVRVLSDRSVAATVEKASPK
ncbi:MAG: hypothetical protein ABIQ72_12970 [Usitatibacter sp.]